MSSMSAARWMLIVSLCFAWACDAPMSSPDGAVPDAACASPEDCDDGLFCNGPEACVAGACRAGSPPCASCDETANACDCSEPDADGDAHDATGCGGDDCDDLDAARHPGLSEVCDADDVDEDCDPITFGERDGDSDTYADARCCNGAICGDDCDDANASVHPTEAESCDLTDNDCDALIDEGVVFDFYPDCDRDGYGDASASATMACAAPAVPPASCPAGAWARNAADCRDADALAFPAAPERCNRLDDDCSSGGGAVAAEDDDSDGHAAMIAACTGGFPKDDCDDASASTYSGATEVCDRADNDCSSGGGVVAGEDADGDAHTSPQASCSGGPFPRDDCDDTRAEIYAGAPELCDGLDFDCSAGGSADPVEDADGDGHAATTAACSGGSFPRDDCDDAEPGAYPGAPLAPPRLVGPENGALTGSLHAAARSTLRPLFRWSARVDCAIGVTHELEVDDSCAPGSFASCAFASPEVRATGLAVESYRHSSDLAVSSSAPVGRRYYWRVRSCDGAACSAWSPVRYLDVGRVRADFNGDGWSDVVVGAPQQGTTGSAFVYDGSASGVPNNPSRSLGPPAGSFGAGFGGSVASAGDVNGDGFADLIVGAARLNVFAGNAFMFYGSASGVSALPNQSLASPTPEDYAYFGISVASAGDVNGDGYADVVVGAPNEDADLGSTFVFDGGASGVLTAPSQTFDNPASFGGGRFGISVASAGDLNGDGYADVVVGAGQQFLSAEGAAYVYHGSSAGAPSAPSRTLLNPASISDAGYFGESVASAGDLNADGYADLVVGAYNQDPSGTLAFEGQAFVYYGSRLGIPSAPSRTLDDPTAQALGRFGNSVASAGDVDGDGYVDLIVGAYGQNGGATDEGNAFLYRGSASGVPSAPSRTLGNPASQSGGRFAYSVASAGDVNGDGYADVVVGADQQDAGATDEGNAFVYHGSASGVSSIPSQTMDDPTNDAGSLFGHSVASAEELRSRPRSSARALRRPPGSWASTECPAHRRRASG